MDTSNLLRFLVAGSVDDGKSTLIGRLLYDSKSLFNDQTKDATVQGKFDPALVTDGLKDEREQGITIDVAYRYFSTPKRKFIICDAPGHEQYTRNMATGASNCELGIILVDARNGLMPQTKRHSFISTLLGIKHLIVAINKMDLVDYSQEVFNKIKSDYEDFAKKLNVSHIHFTPISALEGDNVVEKSQNMDWWEGQPLLSHLENTELSSNKNFIDFRMPVQGVIKEGDFRGYTGQISSGIIKAGEQIIAMPSGIQTQVKEIKTFDGDLEQAFNGMSVAISTTDDVDISRGDVISRINNQPIISSEFKSTVVWMGNEKLDKTKQYLIKTGTCSTIATISSIDHKYDINNLSRMDTSSLDKNDIGKVEINTFKPVCFDEYSKVPKLGSFILIDKISNETVAAGMIIEKHDIKKHSENITWENFEVTLEDRIKLNGHKPCTIWLTGYSGSGKTTIARELEKRLFSKGYKTFILDGDNIRHGLSKDLNFSIDDRNENIRRIAEVSKLMNDTGCIVINSFISPNKQSREQARKSVEAGNHDFIEVFLDVSLEICEKRDKKGLYKKARKGEISNFTGISSPYEKPENPDIKINTEILSVNKACEKIIEKLKQEKII